MGSVTPPEPSRSLVEHPIVVGLGSCALFAASGAIYVRFFKRLRSVEDVRTSRLGGRWIKGVVTSVGDADNFRLWHTPYLHRQVIPSTRAALKDETLHIRLAGVDAPEMAHFGNPAQPFSDEASEWLTKTVMGKKLHVQLFSKDRYGRIVGMVYLREFPYLFRKNVSEEMLKVGLATVYTQKGAVHAGMLEHFHEIERIAKKKRVGMWGQSSRKYESPADFKRRTSQK